MLNNALVKHTKIEIKHKINIDKINFTLSMYQMPEFQNRIFSFICLTGDQVHYLTFFK
jgi:hypothetical protein